MRRPGHTTEPLSDCILCCLNAGRSNTLEKRASLHWPQLTSEGLVSLWCVCLLMSSCWDRLQDVFREIEGTMWWITGCWCCCSTLLTVSQFAAAESFTPATQCSAVSLRCAEINVWCLSIFCLSRKWKSRHNFRCGDGTLWNIFDTNCLAWQVNATERWSQMTNMVR